jgi:S-DNA-T family DNA segregation ATPase FtsK/SpoIIIE
MARTATVTVPEDALGKLLHLRLPGPREPVPGTDLEPAPEVVEAELVDEPAAAPVPVDQPGLELSRRSPWQHGATATPIVAPWLLDRDERRAAVRWARRRLRHKAAFHAVRSPVYVARALDPRSIGRQVGRTARWMYVPDTAARRATAREHKEWIEVRSALTAERQKRAALVGAGTVGFGGLDAAMAFGGHGLAAWALTLAAGAGLGIAGRRRDKPLIDVALVAEAAAPKLTSPVVTDALAAIGVPALAKPGAVKFVAPITREGAAGWLATLDLPLGLTAGDILDKRDRLASALRRPLGCVWPEGDSAEHPGRLRLFVGNEDMNKAKQPPWPLAKGGQADIFRDVPFGYDQRGRLIAVPLIFESVLIGAKPRMGKTFALRLLLLAAALDPSVELRVFELKGTGDCGPLEQVSYHYGSGADDETIENCMLSLREVHNLLETRAATIRGLPKALCPENKVTPELSRRRDLRLQPLLFAIDEVQELFTHPEYGKEAKDKALAIIKRGPAMGIMLVLATQRPDDDSLPAGVSANIGVRFCLRVMGWRENDMVLGTGMSKAGIRAMTFTKNDKGIGYLVGASDDPLILRTSYVDGPAADRIAVRARVLRDAAGTLAGAAAGAQTFDRGPDWSVVVDLLDVMPEDRAHSVELVRRLQELRPGTYEGWDATTLAGALRACEDSRNGRGVVRAHLVEAADSRGLL